jgi:hypothetical protein
VTIINVVQSVSNSTADGFVDVDWTILIKNTTPIRQEVRAFVFDRFGQLIDKHPDLYWADVGTGQVINISFGERRIKRDRIEGIYQVTSRAQSGALDDRVKFDGTRNLILENISSEQGESIVKEEVARQAATTPPIPQAPLGIFDKVLLAGIIGLLLFAVMSGRGS